MAVSNDAIIHKMMQELQQAKQHDDNKAMKKHISHVQILCELLLGEETKTSNKDEISQAEMKAMIEGNQMPQQQMEQKKNRSSLDDDNANGGSIFDF